jgi:hypothetical protein
VKRFYLSIFFALGGWFTWVTVGLGVASVAGGLLNKKSAPATVQYQPVSPQQTQTSAISGNITENPQLESLLSQSNTFQQQQASSLMNQALPGYSGFASALTGTATSLAANPYAIPSSVTGQLQQYAAENNINEGTGASSGFSGSNMLRSLGVNALQYGQANMSSAMNALSVLSNTAPKTSPMSPLSFMVTPSQQQQAQTQTNTLQQQIAQGGANAGTAAANANTTNLWDSISNGSGQALPSIISMLTGSSGGSNLNSVNAAAGAFGQ